LASLASFAKAAQSLPTGDALEFESSFPEFQFSLNQAQESLLQILQSAISSQQQQDDNNAASAESLEEALADLDASSLDDPWLWERAADACDALVEQVEAYLLNSNAADADSDDVVAPLQQFTNRAHAAGTSQFHRMVQNTAHHLPKPQEVYGFSTSNSSSRTAPFVPAVHPDKPHAVTPLDLTLQPGHGYDTRYGALRSNKAAAPPSEIVAPSQHCPHVYQAEIRAFTYTPAQLEAHPPTTDKIPTVDTLTAEWIDTEPALQALAARLSRVTEIALDLEAHSYRSFAGMVCLMQISFRADDEAEDDASSGAMKNYLVDTLKLHHCLNTHLAAVLANPGVVKVLHGADHDIQWLQRDFGLYVVNLFDTGRAARALQLQSAGYAHLLSRYCGIGADKSHQLADWRQRPLTFEMRQYAIQDTHYLLDIYERLKWDLAQQSSGAITEVLDVSRQVCLIRYTPEPFYPMDYRKLLLQRGGGASSRRSNSNNYDLQPHQEAVLRALWDWRDQTARQLDESVQYVCSNQNLRRMALAAGNVVTATGLQAMFHPIPPLVLRFSQEILELIQGAVQESKAQTAQQQQEDVLSGGGEEEEADDEEDDDDDEVSGNTGNRVGAPSSAFFKPANAEKDQKRRGMMSPVLGTEALYQHAGWMTPLDFRNQVREDDVEQTNTTTTDDDDEDGSGKPKKLLSVHASNRDYRTSKTAANAAANTGSGDNRGRSVDGMGSVRAAASPNRPDTNSSKLEEEAKDARENASRIKSGMALQKKSIPAVLGLIASEVSEGEEADATAATDATNKDEGEDQPEDGAAGLEQDFRIPRSIREIYMISNRNRRNKKTGTPTPERGVTPTSDKEREELAAAEALLRERGEAVAGYFDDALDESPEKRARTKSGSSTKSEESGPDQTANSNMPSKDDDLAFMKEIGWIKSNEEVEGLLKQRQGRNRGGGGYEAGAAADGSGGEGPAAVVGVYNPGRPNPFFAGGPLTQQGGGVAKPDRSKKGNLGKSKQNRNRQQERPEKKDSRTHAYRKR